MSTNLRDSTFRAYLNTEEKRRGQTPYYLNQLTHHVVIVIIAVNFILLGKSFCLNYLLPGRTQALCSVASAADGTLSVPSLVGHGRLLLLLLLHALV